MSNTSKVRTKPGIADYVRQAIDEKMTRETGQGLTQVFIGSGGNRGSDREPLVLRKIELKLSLDDFERFLEAVNESTSVRRDR